ncbi:MAG: hypothetical protein R2755_02125 [Acidimicrobiales bacterium]
MIGLLRRLAFALGIATGTAGVLRFTKRPAVPWRRSGWRPLHGPDFR